MICELVLETTRKPDTIGHEAVDDVDDGSGIFIVCI